MAYIPPHKRHSKDSESERPSLIPERLAPLPHKQHRNLKLPSKRKYDNSGDIVYADNAIFKWFIVGNFDADQDNQLEPISVESFEQRMGMKPLVLVNNHPTKGNDEEGESTTSSTLSESVAVNVWPDLLTSFEIVRNKMESKELDEGKPSMVARFGKILFHGTPSVRSESVLRKDHVDETTLRRMKRTFYTNTPYSYMENIISGVVPKIGADLVEEKNIYHIKVELNPIRHMVIDISCIDKNLDLRLALYTKRIISALQDDEMHSFRNIVNSAILDPEVKGGLRWPLGKACSEDRYSVIGVWHTIAKKYKSPSLSLKARHVDRFDFKVAIGESTFEVNLKLRRIVSHLQEVKIERDSICDVFKDNLRMIWDHFLCRD
ncbi:hypothetical protein LWI29_017936 [Acer saccharum]|uniref:DUF7903 domain-containing protein n=1 Tax=Acer saccharum TaxID=4024 RepID=A0AA39W1E5_ACESA|nr:hypothetical protein LWI29_017936 [Acer saccharum]